MSPENQPVQPTPFDVAQPTPSASPAADGGTPGRHTGTPTWVLPALGGLLILALLVISLARPQLGHEEIREKARGVAMEMVVDRSGSMGIDMEYRGEVLTRLDVCRRERSLTGSNQGRRRADSNETGAL